MAKRKQVEPQHEGPDALVWRDGRDGHYLCARCVQSDSRGGKDGLGGAYRAAINHLWRTHGLRRVQIIEDRPEIANAAQLALPLVAQHNTQFDRSW